MKGQQRLMHLSKWLVLILILLPIGVQAENADREKMRQRLEQLFIWKVSDRLQLSPEKENKLAIEYRKLSEEKTKLSQSLDDISDQMEQARADKKKLSRLLVEFRQTAKKNSEAQSQAKELEVMSHILDNSQLAEYVLLKREMFHKFRDVLTTSGASKTAENAVPKPTALKEPEVYQEK